MRSVTSLSTTDTVMVWSGIDCIDGRTELHMVNRGTMTAVQYRDEVLQPIVRSFAGAIDQEFVLRQENTRPHTVRDARAYLEQEGFEILDWLCGPQSDRWDILFRRVSDRENPPQDVPRLTQALIEEWNTLAQEIFRRLIRSMPTLWGRYKRSRW